MDGREAGDLLAQAPHVHVHGAGALGVRVAPDVLEQLLPREHAPARLEQGHQQRELLGRQAHAGARPAHDVAGGVHLEVAEAQGLGAVVAGARSRRRKSARTRATSSLGLNGFTT